MHKALFWTKNNNTVRCQLCPHQCNLENNQIGYCLARKNINGELYSLTYGNATGIHLDPIEKKPLYHFYPGHNILSVGSFGCNMKCKFCQNYHISQEQAKHYYISPQDLVDLAIKEKEHKNIGIAFTYNEPTLSIEYIIDVAHLAKKHNLKIVIVSNGMINPIPLKKLISISDAFNIDLKAFNSNFYKHHGGNIETVKNTIATINLYNKHIELTTLVIPEHNSEIKEITELAKWLATINKNIPLHLTRFFPKYKMCDHHPTPINELIKLKDICSTYLKHVYNGNI